MTRSTVSYQSGAPHAPDAWKLTRFWLAGPLTLILFIPALGAGIFGAPTMLLGVIMGYRALRIGQDTYKEFAKMGFQAGVISLCVVVFFFTEAALMYAFAIVFGPLMAMCFRWIAGSWRTQNSARSAVLRTVPNVPTLSAAT